MPGEETMTTQNRAQRRANPKSGIRQIVKATETPFEPRVIGTISLEEKRQFDAREELMADLERQRKLIDINIQLVRNEASIFVTNVAISHGQPEGGQCEIDSVTGAITLVKDAPRPVPDPIELPVADVAAEGPEQE